MADHTRYHTAIHEAGHAVAHERLGFYCAHVTIVPEGAWLGSALARASWTCVESARAYLTTLYAGYCAGVVAGAPEALARDGSCIDFAKAHELLEFLGDTCEADCLRVAFEFVRKPENWRAIEAIAAELLESGCLEGGHVSLLIDLTDGGPERHWLAWCDDIFEAPRVAVGC